MTTATHDSLAVRLLPDHTVADVQRLQLPPGAPTDPERWARAIFDIASAPRPLRALFAARQKLVPLLGIKPSEPGVFAIDRVEDGEALILARERHLDFACAIARDVDPHQVRVTTAVRLHGWRGRVYWTVVRLFHVPLLRAMMRSAARRLA